MSQSPNTSEANDAWQLRRLDVTVDYAAALRVLHDTNPWPETDLLTDAITYLMTELWDLGFSQTQIRSAFNHAVADMPRYAGEEVRT